MCLACYNSRVTARIGSMKIINLSDFPTQWNWLASEYTGTDLVWEHISTQAVHLPRWLPKQQSLQRFGAAWQAVCLANASQGLLVSHGPRPAFYSSAFASLRNRQLPHLVYSFNFTELPRGSQHKLMAKAYQQPQRFVTYSTAEKQLYAQHFNIPIERIDMIHWSVHRPSPDSESVPIIEGNYICALGSQGRDFATLFAAMRLLPGVQLAVVTHPQYLAGLSLPDNVRILTDIPLKQAHNILQHSRLMVVPLRDNEVPCGHVTIVSGMFFGKPMVVTDSRGVHDYIENGKTGLFCEAGDAADMAAKIELLLSDEHLASSLANHSLRFAEAHCTEKTALNYFDRFLSELTAR